MTAPMGCELCRDSVEDKKKGINCPHVDPHQFGENLAKMRVRNGSEERSVSVMTER